MRIWTQKQRFSLAYFNSIEKCILEGDRIQKSELKIPFGHLQSKVGEKEGSNESIKEIGDIFLLGWLQLILCVTEVLVQKSRGTPTTRRRKKTIMRGMCCTERNRRKAGGTITFMMGSCRITCLGNSSMKLTSLRCSRYSRGRLWRGPATQ